VGSDPLRVWLWGHRVCQKERESVDRSVQTSKAFHEDTEEFRTLSRIPSLCGRWDATTSR
jgi:hypothetical protein